MTPRRTHLTIVHDIDASVQIAYRGQELLTYDYASNGPQLESPRPYIHPLYTLAGNLVSLLRPHDHVWHKGLSWSLPNVGPHNFWGGPTYVRDQGYVQLANNGSMDHQRFTVMDASEDRARICHELIWHAHPANLQGVGDSIVAEQRGLLVSVPTDDAWVLTFSSAITNVSGQHLDIGSPTTKGRENAGYGGLFWRGPRSFTGGTILAAGYAGGEQIRGARAEWMGYTGRHDQTSAYSSLVMVDDRANPHHPPQWFMRNEMFAAVNPAPFFSQEIAFGPGETLRFRYALVIADGPADPARGEELAELGRAALR
jgi:hypothetical protein